MNRFTSQLYNKIFIVVAIGLFLVNINKPFVLTMHSLLFILLCTLIGYFFVEDEKNRWFSIETMTVLFLITYANIQAVFLAITIIRLYTGIASDKKSKDILKKIFRQDNLFQWAKMVVVSYLTFTIKVYAFQGLHLDMDYIRILLLFLFYILTTQFFSLLYKKLNTEKAYDFRLQRLMYIFYTTIGSFFLIYVYYDRGILMTVAFYILMIPYQQISALYLKYKEEEEAANRDSLTGIYNVRYFRKMLQEKINLRNQFTLIMLDLNKFKSINDTYGHLAGDEALKTFVREVSNTIRSQDLFVRYAGDEFCVVLEGSQYESLVDRLEEVITEIPVKFEDKQFNMSSSLGVYHYKGGEETIEHIIHKADKLLYKNKRA